MIGIMVPEARIERTEHGLAPAGEGWFVINAREARWQRRPGRGMRLGLTGTTDEECETYFPQLGVNIAVLHPGEPLAMYHWEVDAEAFLVLSGEALLLVEGQERSLEQWDFFHCPPHTAHTIIGAGEGPCSVLAIGAREHMADDEWGGYRPDQAAIERRAGVDHETSDATIAYARFPAPTPAAYEHGWLPPLANGPEAR